MINLELQKKIPCLDLRGQHQQIKSEIFEVFEKVYDTTSFSGGVFVEEFENNFALFCDTRYAVSLNSGTSALHLAMLALGIGPNDEVIIPANTFIATAWGVSYTGAIPVFADCTADTWQIDPFRIEEKITKKTKAIIGVHLYGQPFNVEAIKTICHENRLFLLEDAAQAQGAEYKGKRVGGFGEMACFSFYPGKNLGACGEAGGITTNVEEYQEHLRSLRNHGSKDRYYHNELGYNMRMGGLEGASLNIKLKYLEGWNNQRRNIASKYQREIHNSKIQFQFQPDWADSIYHLFVITTEDRHSLLNYLNEHHISPGLHYPVPCHLQRAYRHLGYQIGDCPNSEYLANHCLSLPMYPELSEKDTDYVIEIINSY